MVEPNDTERQALEEVTTVPKDEGLRADESSNSSHGKNTSSPGEGSASPSEKPEKPSLHKRERMPTLPHFLKPRTKIASFWEKLTALVAQEANFYRIHLTVFTFTPLIFSGIFYASNTNPFAYIDCLFVCVSAMTVTGLTTINVSQLTAWQQAILFFLMCIGNLSAVSVTMVLIRRHFFKLKFNDVIKRSSKARKKMKDVEEAHQKAKHRELVRLQKLIGLRRNEKFDLVDEVENEEGGSATPHSTSSSEEMQEKKMRKVKEAKRKKQGPLRADMIRRMDEPAVLINQAGVPSRAVKDKSQEEDSAATGGILSPTNDEGSSQQSRKRRSLSPDNIRFALPGGPNSDSRRASIGVVVQSPEEITDEPEMMQPGESSLDADATNHMHLSAKSVEPLRARFTEDDPPSRLRSGSDPASRTGNANLRRSSDAAALPNPISPRSEAFPRTQTIEFAEPFRESHRRMDRVPRHSVMGGSTSTGDGHGLRHRIQTLDVERTPTIMTNRSGPSRRPTSGGHFTRVPTTAKERGFGGFPTPIEIAGSAVQRAFPKLQKQFTRTTTMARTATFTSVQSANNDPLARHAPYLTFDATVSRNSRFHELTDAQKDELGGVEYRAIDLLAKILPAYWLLFNFFFITLVAPWLASGAARRVHEVLATQGVNAPNTTWMWFFQVVSAYSNTGLTLIDTSMILLPDQYFMLIPMGILILAGNTAFPIFLRFFIWCISIICPRNGRMYETLRFLLDHPRRCFVYLFPSGQTWFLFAVLIILNCTDWVFFQILDIGNTTIESWGVGQRIFDGLFQSIAVRAAGFQIISLLSLAPAVQFLYIVMMYISAYPIAMSVRNTNVYEERSLGVYNEEPGSAVEPTDNAGGARVWGNYLAAHARRQLAFDIWWLGFSLWLICIIERGPIQDPASNGWFTVFSCLFELTSAYGTVGLSTGTPYDNFSLSGRFTTLGKLVVIAVMLRGRHRGLPVAIDRAVLLPGELELEDDAQEEEDELIRSRTTMSNYPSTNYFPRTNTEGMTAPDTPRMMTRSASGPGGLSRDRGFPSLDLDHDTQEDEAMDTVAPATSASTSNQQHATSPLHNIHSDNFSHLAAIQEFSPSATPMPMSRVDSYVQEQHKESPLNMTPRNSSERERKREFFGGAKVEQLPSAVDTVKSEEDQQAEERKLDALDRRYREKYGSSD